MNTSTLKILGVLYEVPYSMQFGDSFFIPCLDTVITVNAVKRHYSDLGYVFKTQPRIEAGVQGVRLWRVPPG